jgi:hypothetical protein
VGEGGRRSKERDNKKGRIKEKKTKGKGKGKEKEKKKERKRKNEMGHKKCQHVSTHLAQVGISEFISQNSIRGQQIFLEPI